MIKLIRNNQRTVLAGITIFAMISFVVNFGNKGPSDHAVNDHPYGTINGKTIYVSEVTEARNEIAALKAKFDFEDQQRRSEQAQFFQQAILHASQKLDWYVLLRHEANEANIQIDKDTIGTVIAAYSRDLNPDDDYYPAVYNGTAELLKIFSRFEQVAGMAKVSKPMRDMELVQRQSLSLDLIQYKAADFLASVKPPTTQELQEQFNKFAAVQPHHPDPTTNPSGFGYRLPVRMKLQYIRLMPDAVNAAVAATKFKFPQPDWEVQARKYYLAHLDEFPTTQPVAIPTTVPTTAAAIAAAVPTTLPTGPLPFAVLHDQIMTKIRQPMADSLNQQVQDFIKSTMNNDWQTYSVFINSGRPGPEPASSLAVPYTSPLYFAKLMATVQAKFNVTVLIGETPGGLSAEQLTALPDIGTSELSDLATALATDYLDKLGKSDKSAPTWLNHPGAPTDGQATGTTTFFRLSEVQPSQPAPNLASVQAQVEADLRIAGAYKLAQAKANDVVANLKDRWLSLVDDPKHPVIHLDRLSGNKPPGSEITPELGTAATTFMKRVFDLLGVYDPHLNRNPAETIELPEQARVFAVQLGFVDASWNGESYFNTAMGASGGWLQQLQLAVYHEWFDDQEVHKRLNFVQAGKNKSSDSE